MAQLLWRFYGEVCQSNGGPYFKSALVYTRAGLNMLQGANRVIAEVMKELRWDWYDTTKHKDDIPGEDMRKLYDSTTLSNDNAARLLHAVFSFWKTGEWGSKGLKKDHLT